MTDQRELDRLLDAFFVNGTDELSDRVIEAALDQIDHTRQRRPVRALPWRFQTMNIYTRLAAAAVIAVIAVGGALYLLKPGQQSVSGPSPTAGATPLVTAAPTPTPTPTPVPSATPKPDPMPLTGPLGAGRQIHTATLLADGRVIVAGGIDFADQPLASVTLYDPATGKFSPTGSMSTARAFDTATLLSDGRVLVAGGGPATWVHPGPDVASAELYDPKTGTFSPTGSMGIPREDHTATLLPDGRILIAGGNDTGDHAVASAELYDPKTGKFSPTGSMVTARGYHTATLLADGRVLVAGGDPCGWASCARLASAELYDPKTGKFSPTGSMSINRGFHTATLLADGRVLIAGGDGAATDFVTAELYDPKTGTFRRTGSMTTARDYTTATLIAGGRVLVAGGGGDYGNRNFLASAEIFDPTTGTFTSTGSMSAARTWFQASLLPDGRVLVTGGYGDLAPLASAEIYDPTTGTFSPAGSSG